MRTYQFRLRTLQKMREQKRDLAQRRLAQAKQQRAEIERSEQEVRDQLQGLEQHMRKAIAQQPVEVDRIMDGHRHQLSLQARLADLDSALAQATAEVAECRDKLVEADRDVKILEKLHQRQLTEHEKQQQAHEARQLDEAAIIRAGRQAKTA